MLLLHTVQKCMGSTIFENAKQFQEVLNTLKFCLRFGVSRLRKWGPTILLTPHRSIPTPIPCTCSTSSSSTVLLHGQGQIRSFGPLRMSPAEEMEEAASDVVAIKPLNRYPSGPSLNRIGPSRLLQRLKVLPPATHGICATRQVEMMRGSRKI